MNTPQGKATKLIKKFTDYFGQDSDDVNDSKSKNYSILCAEEVINELSDLPRIGYNERREAFWREVKLELEKL